MYVCTIIFLKSLSAPLICVAADDDSKSTSNKSGLPEGYGPPMANIIVFGMPWSKDNRSAVKAKLRSEAAQHGEVLSLTWGSRKGTCFLSMASPIDASNVIVKVKIYFDSHRSNLQCLVLLTKASLLTCIQEVVCTASVLFQRSYTLDVSMSLAERLCCHLGVL